MSYPLKHISIRVPWHDTGWDGHVCEAPRLNGACLKLKRIAVDRDDDAEESVAGKSIQDLPQAKWPPCIAERVGGGWHRVAGRSTAHGGSGVLFIATK